MLGFFFIKTEGRMKPSMTKKKKRKKRENKKSYLNIIESKIIDCSGKVNERKTQKI